MVNAKKDKLLIVGGTGFIGKSLAKSAIAKGYDVVVLSLNPPSEIERLGDVEYIQADITNIDSLSKKSIVDIEYVVNLSGYINHSKFLDNGDKTIDVHFGGVKNLLQVLNWNKLKRFVQIGSSDEYGSASAPQHESLREHPISSYAVGKAASTQLLQMLARTENFPAVILRLFLVYGPGQDGSRFLPQIVKGCLADKEFGVSSGGQLRDFCYIDDVSDGILRALNSDNVNGEVINLASGEPVSIRTMIANVQACIGKGSPMFGQVAYRVGENMELYADTSKARILLNWSPKTTIQNGIKKTVDYYRIHNLK